MDPAWRHYTSSRQRDAMRAIGWWCNRENGVYSRAEAHPRCHCSIAPWTWGAPVCCVEQLLCRRRAVRSSPRAAVLLGVPCKARSAVLHRAPWTHATLKPFSDCAKVESCFQIWKLVPFLTHNDRAAPGLKSVRCKSRWCTNENNDDPTGTTVSDWTNVFPISPEQLPVTPVEWYD